MIIAWLAVCEAAEVKLTLEEAIERGWAVQVERAMRESRVASAASEVPLARRAENPELRYRYSDIGSRVELPGHRFQLRQRFEPIGAIRARVAAAMADADLERAELEAARAEYAEEVASLFDASRVADALGTLASMELDTCTAWLETLVQRREAELADTEDVLDAEFRCSDARRRRATFEREGREARIALQQALGLDEDVVPQGPSLEELAFAEPTPGAAPTDPVLVAERDLAEAQARETRAEKRPFVDFLQVSTSFDAGEPPALAATVAARLPVFTVADGSGRAADAVVAAAEQAIRAGAAASEARRTHEIALHAAYVDEVRALEAEREHLGGLLAAEREAVPPDVALELELDLVRLDQRRTEALGRAVRARRALGSL